MSLVEADFDYIRDLVYKNAAIVLDSDKGYLVEARLEPVARRQGLASVAELIAKMRGQPADGLCRSVVEAMITNETSFFRDYHPFELLKKSVLPELIKRRASIRQISIWCAAASSGQEPYTILMTLREYFPELASWTITFIASDISNEMLNRCRGGCYSQLEVDRGLPAPLLVKYFQKVGTEWRIRDELRAAIDFRPINLAQPWPAMAPMDIVFMRNVLIYFNAETKKAIFAKVKNILKHDGYLFLGGAETTMGIDNAFKRVMFDKGFYYQPEEG